MGFSIETGVSAFTVFLQGLISFFSPCVLPLLPLYISYLAGGAKITDEDGTIHYPRKKVFFNTVFFVIGISFTFFLLGLGFTAFGNFFTQNRIWFARISGIIMILFGLYQLGIFGQKMILEQEHRLPIKLDKLAMNPFTALLLGFTFSFAWTPCIGPTLSSVLLMVSSSDNMGVGILLIAVYTVGFILPFLVTGFFTGTVLDFFKKHQKVVRYTVKIGAVLLILMGIMTLTGFINGINSYLSSIGNTTNNNSSISSSSVVSKENSVSSEETPSHSSSEAESSSSSSEQESSSSSSELPEIPAPDFTLTDQFGNTHTLSDYKGKTIFLNFWATWCGPCQIEMPEIQALYEDHGQNSEDLVVIGVANPKTDDNQYNQDVHIEKVKQFLSDNNYTFPTVMDTTGELFYQYGISSFPTTFMIDKNGNVFGYIPGSLSREIMDDIVDQTMKQERRAIS